MKEQENLILIEEVIELYKQRKYDELIEKKYISALEAGIRRNEKYFIKDFIVLEYLCFSTYEAGYYYNCLVLMDKLFSNIPFCEEIYKLEEKKYFLDIALESIWYCYINNIELEKDNNNKSILDGILNFSLNFYETNSLEKSLCYSNIEKIYRLTKLGKLPYYKVLFFVPFPLNFDKYTFDLFEIPPFREMEVKREIRGNIEGTSFSITINGFVKADSLWKGAIWEERQEYIISIPAVDMVNRLLSVLAEDSAKDFIPRIRPEQLSSIDVKQYMGDGDLYRECISTIFTGQFINKWFQRSGYVQEELKNLNELLITTYHYPLYATLYHQAKNTINAGLYEESIMTLFACTEAMVHYWCRQIAKAAGVEKEYKDFEEVKHVCEKCSLYQNNPNAKGISTSKLPPSILQYPKFLKKQQIIDNKQERQLVKLISQARNDSLRNDLMHGTIGKAEFLQVKKSQDSIFKMNEIFISIMNKFGRVDDSLL